MPGLQNLVWLPGQGCVVTGALLAMVLHASWSLLQDCKAECVGVALC